MELKWDVEIKEMEEFFKTITLPKSLIVKTYYEITDVNKFIDAHLETVKQNNGKFTFLPYLHRLRSLKIFFEQNRTEYPEIQRIPQHNRVAS